LTESLRGRSLDVGVLLTLLAAVSTAHIAYIAYIAYTKYTGKKAYLHVFVLFEMQKL
jgi:hypothetical protein